MDRNIVHEPNKVELARRLAEADGYQYDNLAHPDCITSPRMNSKGHWLKLAETALAAMADDNIVQELCEALARIREITSKRQLPITNQVYEIANIALAKAGFNDGGVR